MQGLGVADGTQAAVDVGFAGMDVVVTVEAGGAWKELFLTG